MMSDIFSRYWNEVWMKNTHISSLTGLWNRCGAWVATHIRPLARPRLGPKMGSYRKFLMVPKPHRGVMWVSWGKEIKNADHISYAWYFQALKGNQ